MDDVVVAVVAAIATVVLACVATSVSLRLLGIGRGWTKATAAGITGWVVGGIVALGVSDWDWGADGLLLHAFVVAVPATMAAAVLFDLVARPGSLAMGERAGLVVAPTPRRALRRRIAVFRRYRELLQLLRRNGFAQRGGSSATAEPAGVRLRRVLEEAGGVYIKLGQIAATRVDLVPPDVADELAKLQNQVPPEAREAIQDGARGRARRRRRRGVRRVRLGSAGGGVDRPDASRPAPHGRARGREDPAPRDRGSDGARPRRPVAGRRGRPAPHDAGPGDAVGRDGRPVRRQPAGRARLPPRGRRHGGDGIPPRRPVPGSHPAGAPRAADPPAPRAGAVRGLHDERPRAARRVGRRPAGAGRPAAALDARPGAAGRLLPRRSSSGQRVRVPGRHPRSHRLRSGRPPRLDPEGSRRRHDGRPRPQRCQPPARRHRAGRRRHDRGITRAPRAGPRPAAGRSSSGPTARSTPPCCRTSSPCSRSSGCGCRPTW